MKHRFMKQLFFVGKTLKSLYSLKSIWLMATSIGLYILPASAINRVSVHSGNFGVATTWNPAGIPANGDNLIIHNSHTITVNSNCNASDLVIVNGGKLNFTPGTKITINGNFTVYGIAEIIEGNIDFVTPGKTFKIGETGSVIWEPANNTAAGATLFTNSVEDFHPSSNLIINTWYNYSGVPLGSVVSGNFGNVTLSTLTNGLLYEWNQNNQFETHIIVGTLTIDQGWVVLDKSGTISNTSIGAIHLNNSNSYLDLHSGNHPGLFTVTTNSVTNVGGNMNGLYNGNGNIKLIVNGNFTNLGNTILIYNSGIQGVGNGHATMKVTGICFQSHGDFRGIFNLSSSTSGKIDLEFNNVLITGGIFMGQYSCHTGGNNSTIRIKGDLEINFTSSNAKFRGNGLTSLSGVNNNLLLQFIIEGDLKVLGNTAAEFTTSGSTGSETISIMGNATFGGCISNFNFGSHSTNITMSENMEVTGGTVYLSRTNGSLTALLHKNLYVSDGNVSVTAGNGDCNLILNGEYLQTGGSMFLHNNSTSATSSIVYVTVHGNFLNDSGNITFDNNSSSTSQHRLSLNGSNFELRGNASINSSVTVNASNYGIIYFDEDGIMNYKQNGNGVAMNNVKQEINDNCTLKLVNSDLLVAESIRQESDMLNIKSGGILDASHSHIYANRLSANSSVYVGEQGRLRIAGIQGLYNGAATASIMAAGNMFYTLHPRSIVEYYGDQEQIITGTGTGTANTVNQQYGILEINKPGKVTKLNSNNVFIRTSLELNYGELNLNEYNLSIQSGSPAALNSIEGYIKSEGSPDGNSAKVVWNNISPGLHTIPFGTSKKHLIPFMFTPVSGYGNQFSVSTRGCQPDNRPLTHGITNLDFLNKEAGTDKVIDRWFDVDAPGVTATVKASYLGTENTTSPELAYKNFAAMVWSGTKWKLIHGIGNGSTDINGFVRINNMNSWGPMLLISHERMESADLLSFDAILNNDEVTISWTALPNISPVKYTVERSDDEYDFNDLMEKTALHPSGSPLNYSIVDKNPLPGSSWYRLKQHQPDGSLKYSNPVQVDNLKQLSSAIQIESIGPNPFKSHFTAWYSLAASSTIQIKLTGSNGQIVHNTSFEQESGKNSFQFPDGDNLPPGVYILSISNGKSTQNLKLFHI